MEHTRRQILGTTGLAGAVAATGAAVAATDASAQTGVQTGAKAVKPDYPALKDAARLGDAVPEQMKGKIQRPDLVSRQMGINLAIYDPQTRSVHILSPMAAAVWNHVRPDRTSKSIIDMFVLAYQDSGVPPQRVVQDVVYALKQFTDAGLIVAATDAPQFKPRDEKVELVVTDLDLSIQKNGYERPSLRTVTIEQLKRNYDLALSIKAMFCDVYIVGVPGANV